MATTRLANPILVRHIQRQLCSRSYPALGIQKVHSRLFSMKTLQNYVGGSFQAPSDGQYLDVINPANGQAIAKVPVSPPADVEAVVAASAQAQATWSQWTIKARAACMLKLHSLIVEHTDELAKIVVQENGKNYKEAVADVAKANETVEYACSLPQLAAGRTLEVSSGGVTCRDTRVPLGVTVSIVPFNFPLMVPCWTLPIALVMGNSVIVKPSEKVPCTLDYMVENLFPKAGFPEGVLSLLHTNRVDTITTLMEHPTVQAVTFVGSSPVAAKVASTCSSKRCTALGGAKNHLVALPDCDVASAARDIVVSFAGCAGQRCMAASVLLVVGEQPELLDTIVDLAGKIQAGTAAGEMGPVIDQAAVDRITKHVTEAVDRDGAKLLLDGRQWKAPSEGTWIGPSVVLHKSADDVMLQAEVFGPVLSVYQCKSWEEAIAIENRNEFGNAASVYTTNGGHAEWFLARFRAAMLG